MIKKTEFYRYFSKDKIRERFDKKIRYNCSAGLDRINVAKYMQDLDNNIQLIRDKVINDTYTFTKYTELLIPKGKKKAPRVISRPTIRDKLTLSLLHSFLQEVYNTEVDNRLIHTKISALIKQIRNYSHYIKIDIKGFFSHIDHNLLKYKLSELLPESAINIIDKAIKTQTVPKNYNNKLFEQENRVRGIPEGLSISNILADIYLLDLDHYYRSVGSIHFCRYVDDILILCNKNDVRHIKREIENRLSDLKLSFNEDKVSFGEIVNEFCYLGYFFNGSKVGVRKSSIDKFEHLLEKLFSEYSHKKLNKRLFEWKINLKITGCIFENRKYGWLFFYSQIDDIELLKHLDWLIDKLFIRFKISKNGLQIKKFIKTYYEIRYNLHDSNYLMSIDLFDLEDKRSIIKDIFECSIPFTDKEINSLFSKLIRRDLSELEKDIQFFS